MLINTTLQPQDLEDKLNRFWELSGHKILSIDKEFKEKSAPVITVNGKYTARGWTEWTQGFQFGSAILQYEVTGEDQFLSIGRKNTISKMAPHLSHIGVHDHGFNNISTYGNLLRLMHDGKIPHNEWEKNYYELALKLSGAVQASRWTTTKDGGYIYSFNGPHSLFVDTLRSCRILMLSHLLGHTFMAENDQKINLFQRAIQHIMVTAKYAIYYGEHRDQYDERGRTAHESIFNVNDGNYRCPGTQQGYSGFTTWTRGLAWAICGFSEELELLDQLPKTVFDFGHSKKEIIDIVLKAATATADFYIKNTPIDGVPYWDTGAPGLVHLGKYLEKPSDPYNSYEPIDSSAAAIAAQGMLRLGKYLQSKQDKKGNQYVQAGLTTASSLLSEPYISTDTEHQGILLHSIYHQPNHWDHVPKGQSIACNESSMWGDYHARELALYLSKEVSNEKYYTFFNCLDTL